MSDDFARRLADLSVAQRAELERRLLQRLSGTPAVAIPRRPSPEVAPLSSAQQRQWFLDQLEPGSPLYNIPKRIRLSGELEVHALHRSLDIVVARHEALRTTIVSVDGIPHQRIAPALPVPLPLLDLSALPDSERELEVRRLAALETRSPFSLADGPLFRAQLLRLAAQEHVLLLTVHHIVADGWSVRVLFKELAGLYDDLVSGRPPRLADLPIQYGDYALWQRERYEGASPHADLTYWRQRLDGAPSPLRIPTDWPRGPVQHHQGGRVTFGIPGDLVQRLTDCAAAEGATLFMALLAGWKVLLARLSEQEDVIVGSAVAGRTLPETEGIIGCFTNTLVLRTDLSGNPTFRELLARVREIILAALSHQELPFEKLVEALRVKRNLSYHPVFQVLVNYQTYPVKAPEMGRLQVEDMDVERGTSLVDLSLYFRNGPDGLSCQLRYDVDLFKGATVERLASRYQAVLASAAAEPDARISALSWVDSGERSQLVEGWTPETQSDAPPSLELTERLLAELEAMSNEDASRRLGIEEGLVD